MSSVFTSSAVSDATDGPRPESASLLGELCFVSGTVGSLRPT